MFENNQGNSELNPRPIRIISTMGDITIRDWFIFFIGIGISAPIFFIIDPHQFGINNIENNSLWGMAFRLGCCLPILAIFAVFAFVQNAYEGKLRTRFMRWIRYVFSHHYISPIEMKNLYSIREIKDNHVHYKSSNNEGVISIFRIEGFDPSLLENAQFNNLLQDFTNFFGCNIRYKILSTKIVYTIPPKKIALDIDHYGVNFAINRYVDRIADINSNDNFKQQAYFLIIDGPSINKNNEAFEIISSPISDSHVSLHVANPEEINQILNLLWCDCFDYANPSISKLKSIICQDTVSIFTKHDGTHEYVSILSFNSIPEVATICWLGKVFNDPSFDILMDISPMSPQHANKYMDDTIMAADSITQTKWFKKRASDTERLKISHIKDVSENIMLAIANGEVQLKDVCFYLIFKDKTRKNLKKKINAFKEQMSSFSSGWMATNCKYLQKDAIINTRLYDIPFLQYHKSALNLLNVGKMSFAGAKEVNQSYTNRLPIINAINHKILTTSLGISFPFFSRSSIATPDTWFKGFELDDGASETQPFFNDYWKTNEMYNSFNRFYQGRNGSGKSYTANIDLIQDRLDDKFLISIDPKPERDVLTKNLGGENLVIGGATNNASFINIFDVLITPDDSSGKRQNPLLIQYQSNLSNMAILLSLNPDLPEDKIVLSCFNDIQIYVYEKVKKINQKTDFVKLPKNKYPILKDFYDAALKFYKKERVPETKTAFNKLIVLMKEHATGVSSPIFNNYTNVDWSTNRMWNLIVRDIALNYGNTNILACWILNIIRIAEAFMMAGQHVVLYIDELHLIHNINGVLNKLDQFARIDRSFKGSLCLINQNFNSIRSTADAKKKEYYESIFTMSQYNLFFTTGEDDVLFLVDMLSGSGQPLSLAERSYITRSGRGKALLVMNAYDRYRVQFDISYWRELWEQDLEPLYKQSLVDKGNTQNKPSPVNNVQNQELSSTSKPTRTKKQTKTQTTINPTSVSSESPISTQQQEEVISPDSVPATQHGLEMPGSVHKPSPVNNVQNQELSSTSKPTRTKKQTKTQTTINPTSVSSESPISTQQQEEVISPDSVPATQHGLEMPGSVHKPSPINNVQNQELSSTSKPTRTKKQTKQTKKTKRSKKQ